MAWATLFEDLIRRTPVQSLRPGSLLFSAGDVADRLFYLQDGAVKLFTGTATGTESVLHVFREGDVFGLPAMVGLGHYPVSAEVLEAASVVVLRRMDVQGWLQSHPGGVAGVMRVLGDRYLGMIDDLAAIKVLTPRQRLCRYLVQQAGEVPEQGEVRFTLAERHAVIAARIGLTPENLSRAFARLKADGVVVRYRSVVIEDVAMLRRLADGQIV